MSNKLKKRKKAYKPKQLDPNAHFNSLVMARPLSETVKTKFLRDVDVALLAMSRGLGNQEHFHILGTMVEVSAILNSGLFYVKSYEPIILEAKNGLYRAKERYKKMATIGLDGVGLQSLKDASHIFSDILDNITGNDLSKAIDIINANLQKKNFYSPDEQ